MIFLKTQTHTLALLSLFILLFMYCSSMKISEKKEFVSDGTLRVFAKIDFILQDENISDEEFEQLILNEADRRASNILTVYIDRYVDNKIEKQKLTALIPSSINNRKIIHVDENDYEAEAMVDYDIVELEYRIIESSPLLKAKLEDARRKLKNAE